MTQSDAGESQALLDELATLLRPPGLGIHAVSTGRAAILAASDRYLAVPDGADGHPERAAVETAANLGPRAHPRSRNDEEILRELTTRWRAGLRRLLDPEVGTAMLAIPSDNGAGIVRGAMHGPQAIRERLGHAPVLDLGDVFCIPMLLDDEMCSPDQRARASAALYPELMPSLRVSMPVSPLSIARRAIEIVRTLRPSMRLMVLGGDHTVTWPVIDALFPGPDTNLTDDPTDRRPAEARARDARTQAALGYGDLGIVHFDAHTDLLPHRLGIRYCFATWAWHANQRIGGGGRLLQLGIRASGREQAHWESSLDVRQVWAREAMRMEPAQLAQTVVSHLRDRGVRRVYVSNDLDGTDAYWAAACGTPEPDGLSPDHVLAVLAALAEFEVVGADLVELAPGLSLDLEASARSIDTACRYVRTTLELLASAAG